MRRAFFPIALLVIVFAFSVVAAGCASGPVRPSDPRIAVMGRADRSDPSKLRFGYPGVTVRVAFEGPSLAVRASATSANARLAVTVDGGAPRVLRLTREESTVVLAEGLGAGPHTVELVHRTEHWQAIVTLRGFIPAPGGRLLAAPAWPARRLMFIGDSVTCGEAIDRQAPPACAKDAAACTNPPQSYGMLLGRALQAQVHLVCYGGRGLTRDWRGNTRVANAPQFFDLAVVDPPQRAPWHHADYVPDAVVISLGTNDFNLDLGPFPERESFVATYVTFVRAVRAAAPTAHIFVTEGAIINDETDPARPQKTVLRGYLAEVATRLGDARVHVVPATHHPGDACDAHPTGEQHAEMARELEPVLRAALGW